MSAVIRPADRPRGLASQESRLRNSVVRFAVIELYEKSSVHISVLRATFDVARRQRSHARKMAAGRAKRVKVSVNCATPRTVRAVWCLINKRKCICTRSFGLVFDKRVEIYLYTIIQGNLVERARVIRFG